MAVSGSTWIASLEEQARAVLPPEVFRYFQQGAREGVVAGRASAAWSVIDIAPRIFADVREVDLGTDFLGFRSSGPYGVAPTTLQRAADPGAEVAMASACRAVGVPMVVSSNASATFEEIGATGAHWWLQAYLPDDRSRALPMLDAAVRAGATAVVLTVDTPVVGTKYDDGEIWRSVPSTWVRTNLGDAAEEPKARDLGPADVTWLRDQTGLPVVIKGVLRSESATAAVIAGAAALWVSNHGGRQLDAVPATAECLEPVVDRVAGAVPVYVDGGVRTGLDVLRALAIGADGVFLGRLPLWALSADGRNGVRRLFDDLREELSEALILSGCSSPGAARGLAVNRS